MKNMNFTTLTIQEAIAHCKQSRWLAASKLIEELYRDGWRKDKEVAILLSNFQYQAEQCIWYEAPGKNHQSEVSKILGISSAHEVIAMMILERLEAAFLAGYPSLEGQAVLLGKELKKVKDAFPAFHFRLPWRLSDPGGEQ